MGMAVERAALTALRRANVAATHDNAQTTHWESERVRPTSREGAGIDLRCQAADRSSRSRN